MVSQLATPVEPGCKSCLMTVTEEGAERPRGLAGEYLEEALDALHAAGDPASLYATWMRDDPELQAAAKGFAVVEALNNRRRFARRSMLFSALAGEAYVNEFLAHHLGGQDLAAIDRMSTVNKYVIGTQVATGVAIFSRDAEPVQTISALFKHRDKLVHPKPGYGPPRSPIDAAREIENTFTPTNAARFLLHVAAAAIVMSRRVRPGEPDFPADLIWPGRSVVMDYAARAAGTVPNRLAQAERPLMSQVIDSFNKASEPESQ